MPSFGSFGQAVSEEKIFLNRPIRNKNCVSLEGFKTLGSVSVGGQGIPIPDGSWVE
jgi:hypothetical protein